MKRLIAVTILCYCFTSSWAATHRPQDFLNSIAGSKTEGQQLVQHYCVTCHSEKPLISLGAPRMGHAEDWGLRLKQPRELLFKHTTEGYGAMPARGGCFECTDTQLLLAIEALVR